MSRRILMALVALSLLTAGCQVAQQLASGRIPSPSSLSSAVSDVKEVGEKVSEARKDLSPENEYFLGRAVSAGIASRAGCKLVEQEALDKGELGEATAYVSRVGNLVALAAMARDCGKRQEDGRCSDDRPAPVAGWHFALLPGEAINAYAAPGGFVFLTLGTVKAAASEDELAAVLAHEVAHVLRGHGIGSIKSARWADVVVTGAGKVAKQSGIPLARQVEAFGGSIDDIVGSLFTKGYSRGSEYEADKLAVQIAREAGYDPGALGRFLANLEKTEAKGSGGFKDTHPSAADRIKELGQAGKLAQAAPNATRSARFAQALQGLH